MKTKTTKPDQATLTARVIKMGDSMASFMGYMPNPDEVLRNAGEALSIYREMKIDGRVKSLLTVAKSAVLNYPIRLDASQARAEVVKEVKRCLDDFPLENVVKRLLSAMDYGYAAVELIWKNDAGWWRPDDVVARKPERFSFDQEGRLKHRTRDGTLLDLYSQSYKWLVWRHDKDAENPYGTSILKACYWPWKFKKAGLEFWLMATEKFSVPSILALFETQDGDEKARTRAAELARALGEVSSGSGAALANIKSVEVVSVDGKLSEFKALMDWCDTQIAYAIVYQSLAVQEAENGTRAQAEVHADTFLSATKQTCRDIAPVLQQIVDWIVELNFGPDEEAPQVQFDLSDYASWDVVKEAIELGVPVSIATLYDRYGLPRPDAESDAFLQSQGDGQGLSSPGSKPTGNTSMTAQTDVQSTALNGAQVTALLDLAAKVTEGRIPLESARAMAKAAFPLVGAEDIDSIFTPLKDFSPTPFPGNDEFSDDVKKKRPRLRIVERGSSRKN